MAHWLAKVVELLCAETADLRELAGIAGYDPRTFYRGINPDKLDLAGQDVRGIEFHTSISDRIAQIREAKSRGERLARLLAEILQNRAEGLRIIDEYGNDTSWYATAALGEIRDALAREHETGKQDNHALIRALRRPLAHQMGSSRANLTYYLAKHLSQYPDIKAYLRKSYVRISTRHIDPYRSEIERLLGLG